MNRLNDWRTIFVAVFMVLAGRSLTALGEDFIAEFDGPEVSWQVSQLPPNARVMIHQRRRGVSRDSEAAAAKGVEFVRFNASRENTTVRLEHPIPAATVFDEFEASLWVKSNRDSFSLVLRIRLPDVIDPETKQPRTLLVYGDRYTTAGQWQQLTCRTADRSVSEQVRLLRAMKQVITNPKSMYVDRVILEGQLPAETTDLQLDDLRLHPLVRFQANTGTASSEPGQKGNPSIEDPASNEPQNRVPVKFRLHQLEVEGRRFFPRIVNYRKERPEVLASAGFNVAWVQDYEDAGTTAPLRRHGLWVTAQPPFAKGASGEPLDSEDASLLPFGSKTGSVLFWMLGARMNASGPPRLTSWTNQIRDADRSFKRPIAADVIDDEGLCSRHVDMLGISRHVIHSNCTIVEYRDWLKERRDQTRPDTFCWTWIQTELNPSLDEMARGIESGPMIEPEQIRLQVYAALAAGFRGIGYWTTTPLDGDSPAARERLLAITQLNLELDLFENWLAAGGMPEPVRFTVGARRTDAGANLSRARGSESSTKARTAMSVTANRPREMQAAMIGSERGALLLPMWTEDNAQYVPGPSTAKNVTIVIPGGGETAAAWEISTTGRLRHLDRELAAGGVQIKLPRLDQTAALIITSDQSVVDELNRKIALISEQSAQISVDLAKLKLDRIRQVDLSLQNLGVAKPDDSRQWLGRAKLQLDKAEAARRAQEWPEARLLANEAMEDGRHLQQIHWEYATRRLPSPAASPWSVSFQSLPEHWRLHRRIERHGNLDRLENLLPSGEFEDPATMIAENWKNEQLMKESVRSSAELYGIAKQGRTCLRLLAAPLAKDSVPKMIPAPPVTVVSPGISVHAGQYVRITGWAKVPAPIVGSIDGAIIYDSLMGKPGAVRLKTTQDWKQFEFVRPVRESQDMTITISLQGLGELLVDDVRISVVEFEEDGPATTPTKSTVDPARFAPLDLRRLNPIQKRRP